MLRLIVTDRTRPVASGGLLEVTGRWGSCVRSGHYALSGHHLTVRIGRSVFEERDDIAAIH